MKLHVLIITIFAQIKFNYGFYDQIVLDRFGLKEFILDLSNVNIDTKCHTRNKTCIWKCCPQGHIMGVFKTCYKSDVGFSNITVYDNQHVSINKSLGNVFEIVPNLFNDTKFAKNALWWSKGYLREDGKLFLKFPNVYYRWKQIEVNHFCVDMKRNMDKNEIKPVFMVEYEIEHPRKPNIFKKWALIISTICLILAVMVYSLIPQLRDISGILLMINFCCLILTLMTHCFLESYTTMKLLMSEMLGITFTHYFFKIASFCWTNVMFYRILMSRDKSVAIHWAVVLAKGCAYAIGLPIFLTIAVATIELSDMSDTPSFVTPQIQNRGNFSFHEIESLYYLCIPIILILSFNWIVCFLKVIEFCKTSRRFTVVAADDGINASQSSLNRPMMFVKLLAVLSLYGLLEMLTVIYPTGAETMSATYTLCIGPIIMIIFVVNKDVLQLLAQKMKIEKTENSNSKLQDLVVFFTKK